MNVASIHRSRENKVIENIEVGLPFYIRFETGPVIELLMNSYICKCDKVAEKPMIQNKNDLILCISSHRGCVKSVHCHCG